MKSLRFIFIALALLLVGGAARADDRLWDLVKEFCLDTGFDKIAFEQVVSQKWNMKPKRERDADDPEQEIAFKKNIALGRAMAVFSYTPRKPPMERLHCSLTLEIKDKQAFEALFKANFQDNRLNVMGSRNMPTKRKENEMLSAQIEYNGEKYSLFAVKKAVKADDIPDVPPFSIMILFGKITFIKN
jgi:hypothetical protein